VTAPAHPRVSALEYWRRAVDIREEWLDHGLATKPADRVATEHHLIRIHARLGRPRPDFTWVESPHRALPLVAGLPTLDVLYRWVKAPPRGKPPVASDLAAALSRLRSALDAAADHPALDPPPGRKPRRKGEPWPDLPAPEALAAGVPLRVVLHRGVRESLETRLAQGFHRPVRAALAPPQRFPVCWYGQQEASWIAYYDALRRLGLARYRTDDEEYLDDWAGLARSCGWFWPDEHRYVVVERPTTVHIGQLIGYRDGWQGPAAG
jgi:hypothetical protein